MENGQFNTELIKRLKGGDVAAFDAIYNKYCRKLHGFVWMYLKQEEDAEEIVQEVFIRIWESKAKIDLSAPFESFLFTIAYNATMSLLRKRIREAKSRAYLKSLQQGPGEQVSDEIHFRELDRQVQTLLQKLTPRQKEIYLLSREEGLSHKEIAQKLGISESTVNNHLVAVIKYLKLHINSRLAVNILFSWLFFC